MNYSIKDFDGMIARLKELDTENMYMNDFDLTGEKTDDEIEAVWTVADA